MSAENIDIQDELDQYFSRAIALLRHLSETTAHLDWDPPDNTVLAPLLTMALENVENAQKLSTARGGDIKLSPRESR